MTQLFSSLDTKIPAYVEIQYILIVVVCLFSNLSTKYNTNKPITHHTSVQCIDDELDAMYICEDDIDVFKETKVDEKFVDWYGRKKQWLENGVAKRKTISRFAKLNL